MTKTVAAIEAAAIIKQRRPNFTPQIAIILGSGLGSFASQINDCLTIPYSDLPGFPTITVHGHSGNLFLGYIGDVAVVCLQGRAHSYEGEASEVVKTYVRTLKLLGAKYFFVTNASGSLREDVGPGSLMLINDHINMQPSNPLIGPNDEMFGPRFYPLDNAYDKDLQTHFLDMAQKNQIVLNQGVYISVLGPHYETVAEIRAFKQWGADAVGMSTVPEVLVAKHCGLRIAVIALITNHATGLSKHSHSHEAVVEMANQASEKLNLLLVAAIKNINLVS